MDQSAPDFSERYRLTDENARLRLQLERSLKENAHIVEDRDRLQLRVAALEKDLHFATNDLEQPGASEVYNVAEEELRIAFEELQALTEELEEANASLQQFNSQLEERVASRTREIADANAALRRSEAALRAVADVVPDLLWRTDHIGNIDWINGRWSDLTGKSVEQVISGGWPPLVHEEDLRHAEQALAESIDDGRAYQREIRMLDKHGAYRWFLTRMEPMRDDRGNIVQWFGAAMDMHDQRIGMEALRQSEARLSTLIHGMPQLVWRSVCGGCWTWCSPQWGIATGQAFQASLGRGWLNAFHPDDRADALAAWEAAGIRGSLEFEGRIFFAVEGRYRHYQTRAIPVRGERGDIVEWLGTSTDVDELVKLQNEQTVLVSELQHRTRNLMAVAQVVIGKTIRSSSSMADFSTRIGERMQALARVQNLLSSRTAGARIAFDRLLKEELSVHASLDENGNASQITLAGPLGILLRSSTIQTFALALHELATNAVKYGALSRPEGHLAISWGIVAEDRGDPWLIVQWRETGVGNQLHLDNGASGRFGYGRELIERALPYQLGARTRYAFQESGLECSIEVQIPGGHSSTVPHSNMPEPVA